MDPDWLETAFRLQAGMCRHLGSPLYADLLEAMRVELQSDGPLTRLIQRWQGDPVRGFLPLRLLGAVHESVLHGDAPELARFYPTAGGTADARAAYPHFRSLVEDQWSRLLPRLANFPQTNEVRRSAGLLGGFLETAGATGLPLRLREIGCSAGLNLQWARYRYALGPHRYGDPGSPVQIAADWSGAAPRRVEWPDVEGRAGCDIDPPPIHDDASVRRIEAYIWADQPERLAQLRGAVAIARADPPRIETRRAVDWLAIELAESGAGVCTVVYHSAFWLYLDADEQARVRDLIEARGAAASRRDPLAWLRHEDDGRGGIDIRLRLWPGGDDRLLGHGHAHGRSVRWLA